MPSFPYVRQVDRLRQDPLGPQRLNQAHANIEAINSVALVEHSGNGKHNAIEVPFVLGHIEDGATPTGFLFDTAFGGGTLARPGTGNYSSNVVAGVIPASTSGLLQFSAMANVNDPGVETKPHTITVEGVSATSFVFRIRELTSALGAGNSWGGVNRAFDIGIHAPAQAASVSLLGARLQKQRRNFLTEQTTDWNALVANQAIANKAALVEHTSAGVHSANRIAKASGWFRPIAGPSFDIVGSHGVASVLRSSLGVVQVTTSATFTATTSMACFPEAQPATRDELVIVCGRAFSTTTFRFYIYAYDGVNWARADRPFFAAMFGAL